MANRASRKAWAWAGAILIGMGLVLLAAEPAGAEECEIEWALQLDGERAGYEFANVAVLGADTYVGGSLIGTLPGQTAGGLWDVYLRKYDADGEIVWTRQVGTATHDLVQTVAARDGVVYVAGYTSGVLVPGASSLENQFIRAYDTEGDVLWTVQFGVDAGEDLRALAVDDTGLYVAGSVRSAFPGQTYAGATDAYVRKYDLAGNLLWTRQFGTGEADQVNGLAAAGGKVFAAGTTSGVLPGQADNSTYGPEAFLRCYDGDGTEQWTRQYGTVFWGADGTAIAADAESVYVAGNTIGVFPGQGGHPNPWDRDAYVRKYDHAGVVQWTRQYGTNSNDYGPALAVDGARLLLAGRLVEGISQPIQGQGDAYLAAYDGDGVQLWLHQLAIPGDENFRSVAAAEGRIVAGGTITNHELLGADTPFPYSDAYVQHFDADGVATTAEQFGTRQPASTSSAHVGADGCAYVAGVTQAQFAGDDVPGTIYVRKHDPDGNVLWTRTLSGGNSVFDVRAADGAVYVAGWFQSTMEGVVDEAVPGVVNRVFLVKFDDEGNLLWGTPSDESISQVYGAAGGMAVDASGVYVGCAASFQRASGGYERDMVLLAFGEDGTLRSTTTLTNPGNDQLEGVAGTGSGAVITGYTWGGFPGHDLGGWVDVVVARFDADGNLLWLDQEGDSGSDVGVDVHVQDGRIYALGRSNGTFDGTTTSGGIPFLRSYEGDGTVVDTIRFAPWGWALPYALTGDGSGLVVAGALSGTMPGQVSQGNYDAFVLKLDFDGSVLCGHQVGGPSSDAAYGIAYDGRNLYVSGLVYGSVFTESVRPANLQDMFLLKLRPLDSDGDGLNDAEEEALGTDPLDPDTDDDGLLDGTEVEMAAGSGCPDPLDEDSDDDTLLDGAEVALGTSPCDADTDGDGCPDGIDPLPLEAGASDTQLEELALEIAELLEALPLDVIDGANDNAKAGRRNSLAVRARNAAKATAKGERQTAEALLATILKRLAGDDSWVTASEETAELLRRVTGLHCLLDQ